MKRIALAGIAAALSLVSSSTADQTGAENAKKPVTATIVSKSAKAEDDANPGNVQVTYEDGTKDLWTTRNNCSLARVAKDGTVGWTVHGEKTTIAASYKVRPNNTLVLCRQGKVIRKIDSPQPFIQDWGFSEDGRTLVIAAMFAHGQTYYSQWDRATGKLLAEAKDADEKLPPWAKPFHHE